MDFETLFTEWTASREFAGFVRDGIIDPGNYERPHILFVLRDMNCHEEKDLCECLRTDGSGWKTWNNIGRWTKALLDGSEGYPGCIYTQNYNSKDFTDRHTVIYGHNMRDGTMFSDLHKFEDEEYFYEENNRYVFIYTPDDVFAYRIFAAYQTNSIHQLLGYDIETDEAYLDYLNGILTRTGENCIVDGDIEVDADTKLLTLSTCVMAERQFHLRYLVRGVMLDVE